MNQSITELTNQKHTGIGKEIIMQKPGRERPK
jgi:hypothetical protein